MFLFLCVHRVLSHTAPSAYLPCPSLFLAHIQSKGGSAGSSSGSANWVYAIPFIAVLLAILYKFVL